MGGWEKFDTKQKTKYPVRWFLFDELPTKVGHFKYRWSRRIWAIKHRYIPKHQYHIIRTSLDPQHYYDPDTQILYAVMDLVSQFSEKSNEIIEWESGMPEHSRVRKELDAICDWWIHKYPNREQELPDFPDIDFGKVSDGNHEDDPDVQEWRRIADIHNNKEVVWRQEEMEMLIRVMKIRNHLWY